MILAAFFDLFLAAVIVASTFFCRYLVKVLLLAEEVDDDSAVWEAAIVSNRDVLLVAEVDAISGGDAV